MVNGHLCDFRFHAMVRENQYEQYLNAGKRSRQARDQTGQWVWEKLCGVDRKHYQTKHYFRDQNLTTRNDDRACSKITDRSQN